MNNRWNFVVETEANLPNDAIPFTLTPQLRDAAAMVRCDIEKMQRRHRDPIGLETGTASELEWNQAKEAFRVSK